MYQGIPAFVCLLYHICGIFSALSSHEKFLSEKVQKTLDIPRSCGIITNVPGDKPMTQKQNMRIWRNWQTR